MAIQAACDHQRGRIHRTTRQKDQTPSIIPVGLSAPGLLTLDRVNGGAGDIRATASVSERYRHRVSTGKWSGSCDACHYAGGASQAGGNGTRLTARPTTASILFYQRCWCGPRSLATHVLSHRFFPWARGPVQRNSRSRLPHGASAEERHYTQPSLPDEPRRAVASRQVLRGAQWRVGRLPPRGRLSRPRRATGRPSSTP